MDPLKFPAIHYAYYAVHMYAYLPYTGIYAFVIEKDGVTDSEEEVVQHLKQLIRKQIGGFAVPEAFLVRAYCNYYVQV